MDEGRACQVDTGDSGKMVVTEMEPVYTSSPASPQQLHCQQRTTAVSSVVPGRLTPKHTVTERGGSTHSPRQVTGRVDSEGPSSGGLRGWAAGSAGTKLTLR